MCFYLDYRHQRPMIALRKITCYKVVNHFSKVENIVTSVLYNHCYVLGKRQPHIRLKKVGYDKTSINEGYHSYFNLPRALMNKYETNVIVKCVIPVGAKYYYNPACEEYVSSSLIVKEILDNPYNKKNMT